VVGERYTLVRPAFEALVDKIVVGSMGMVAVGIAALVVVVGQQVVVPLWQLVAVVLLGG